MFYWEVIGEFGSFITRSLPPSLPPFVLLALAHLNNLSHREARRVCSHLGRLRTGHRTSG